MVPVPKKSISHFIHPEHELITSIDDDYIYTCGGCMTRGHGKRYKCQSCSFDMHEYCGTCPETLSSFVHNDHALFLVDRKAESKREVDRLCDVCNEMVEGLFYRCKKCEFDVHPLCTQLPEKLRHALHKVHTLCLESEAIAGSCAVCGGLCNGWRYRCNDCNFDIHLYCAFIVPPPQFPPGHDDGVTMGRRIWSSCIFVGRLGLGMLSTIVLGVDVTGN